MPRSSAMEGVEGGRSNVWWQNNRRMRQASTLDEGAGAGIRLNRPGSEGRGMVNWVQSPLGLAVMVEHVLQGREAGQAGGAADHPNRPGHAYEGRFRAGTMPRRTFSG